MAGFEQALGNARIRLMTRELPDLPSPRDGFALVMPDKQRIFIAADDHKRARHRSYPARLS